MIADFGFLIYDWTAQSEINHDASGLNHKLNLQRNLFSSKYSAICTAFVAAPLRRLSETIQRLSEFACDSSLRMRPTNTSSFPSASIGIGYFCWAGSTITTIPFEDDR